MIVVNISKLLFYNKQDVTEEISVQMIMTMRLIYQTNIYYTKYTKTDCNQINVKVIVPAVVVNFFSKCHNTGNTRKQI